MGFVFIIVLGLIFAIFNYFLGFIAALCIIVLIVLVGVFFFSSLEDKEFTPAPIITDPTKRGYEQEFRREGDPSHIFHINQRQPKGLPKKIIEFVSIAGIDQSETRDYAEDFINGTERHLELERDPANKYDLNAIKVMGIWRDNEGKEYKERIGWISAEVAKVIAKNYPGLPIAATIKTVFRPHEGKSPGIRMDIWLSS